MDVPTISSSVQPVNGVWDMFANLAGLYVQDRQAERAQVGAFNQYSYNALANSDVNNLTGFGAAGNTAASNAALAQRSQGLVLSTNNLIIGAALAFAVWLAVK